MVDDRTIGAAPAAGALACPSVQFDPTVLGADLDAYLVRTESRVRGVRHGKQKEIVWANPATKARTPLAIVYVHGFDAAKEELRPLPDMVAAAFGANLFYTRLAGHGQDAEGMACASAQAWVNDFAEALAIGRAIGQRVVVIANSTGASLATCAAVQPGFGKQIAAYVLTSPNYGLKAPGGHLLTKPWTARFADWLVGKVKRMTPTHEIQERMLAGVHLARAVLPVAAMAELAWNAPVERIDVPTLFIFCDRDRIVRADLTRQVAARWGARHEMMVVPGSDDPANHRLAGDEMSPSTTTALARRIIEWVRTVNSD